MGAPFSTRLRYHGGEERCCGVAVHRFWSWTILGQSDYDSTDAARVPRAPCAATQGKCACFFGAHGLLGCSASTSCQQFVPPSVWQVKSVPPMAGHPRFVRPLARALALCRVASTGGYRRCVGCKVFFDCRYRVRQCRVSVRVFSLRTDYWVAPHRFRAHNSSRLPWGR